MTGSGIIDPALDALFHLCDHLRDGALHGMQFDMRIERLVPLEQLQRPPRAHVLEAGCSLVEGDPLLDGPVAERRGQIRLPVF